MTQDDMVAIAAYVGSLPPATEEVSSAMPTTAAVANVDRKGSQ
jgi:hypothetical protein